MEKQDKPTEHEQAIDAVQRGFELAREMAIGSFEGEDYKLAEDLSLALLYLKRQRPEPAE